MKVVITGASGFLGQNIIENLQKQTIKIIGIERKLLYGDPQRLADKLSGADVVINLAGAPIIKRWTSKNKAIIYNSRVLTTKNITKAINSLPKEMQPKTFVSASAVGIYREGLAHDETSSRFANHFAARVTDDWEDALVDLPDTIRQVIFRIGVVLGKDSQFIQRVLPIFKMGLGGRIGNGKQPFPFIHVHDLVQAFVEAVTDERYLGIYNLVAPQQIDNKTFTQILAKKMNRPAVLPVPAIALKLAFGKASTLILKNPVVLPKRLQMQNFPYRHPTLESCLDQIFD
ncbi:TIGR01777 family oxidoreductase [uncultured Sunxiuqinia sp.]|uniref:TIGR01777 family oxidoreductase n=1 Tax=uncultured Sunxiuqinia sp. TaxID=1573825 RepID=UPI0030D8DF7E|tara:strand:- start:17513 stop:18373 length:861 start_codon:yes stop_codon:yes gene_type:complete